jgi:hypothetical protein
MNDVLIKLTGLWERERRGNPGNTYWSGRLGAAKILVFKNNRKESDSDPDYNVFITEPSPPRQGRPPAAAAARGHSTHAAAREIAYAWSHEQRDQHERELAERFDQRPPDEVPW